eukprot:1631587-Pleurochrysis_carterae.AAC.9
MLLLTKWQLSDSQFCAPSRRPAEQRKPSSRPRCSMATAASRLTCRPSSRRNSKARSSRTTCTL